MPDLAVSASYSPTGDLMTEKLAAYTDTRNRAPAMRRSTGNFRQICIPSGADRRRIT